jgi:hypothetical protein
MCKFSDAVGLSSSNGLARDQFSPYSNRQRASGDEAECGALIHSTGSNQRNGGKHCLQVANVIGSSDVTTRHNLDEVGVEFPGRNNASGSQGPWNYDNILFHRKPDRVWIKTITG